MKKSEWKMMIREVVREELKLAFKEFINENNSTSNITSQPTPKKTFKERKFAKNTVINDILNETAADDNTLGDGIYDTSRMSEILGNQYSGMKNNNPNELANSMGFSEDTAPDFLTKDYSAVMKAMDSKKQGK
tara:strand:+ start:1052 stop:1450 length:399 start_codon:yes stop_codon:yes gene_type:complete